jgi:hypothetical protein
MYVTLLKYLKLKYISDVVEIIAFLSLLDNNCSLQIWTLLYMTITHKSLLFSIVFHFCYVSCTLLYYSVFLGQFILIYPLCSFYSLQHFCLSVHRIHHCCLFHSSLLSVSIIPVFIFNRPLCCSVPFIIYIIRYSFIINASQTT